MITLYLVRHGETVGNLEDRIQGHEDSPLSELGVGQVQAIADRLAQESFAAIYSSDLGRARATAEAVASRHDLPVQTTDLLREAYFGLVQGLTAEEFAQRYPAEFRKWREDSVANRPPEAERVESVVQRCGAFLEHVEKKHKDGERVLAAVHAGSLRGVICAACNLPVTCYTRIRSANASLSIVELGDRPALCLLNDTCHLRSSGISDPGQETADL